MALPSLLHVPLAPWGGLEHPDRHGRWVPGGVTGEVLLGWEERVEVGGVKERLGSGRM